MAISPGCPRTAREYCRAVQLMRAGVSEVRKPSRNWTRRLNAPLKRQYAKADLLYRAPPTSIASSRRFVPEPPSQHRVESRDLASLANMFATVGSIINLW